MTSRPAMTDVAALAGVSHQTVSRVVNGSPNVSVRTRDAVLAAMAQLGYRHNRIARTLATGRSQTIAALAQASTLFGPASLLAAFQNAARAAGFEVAVTNITALDRVSLTRAVEAQLELGVAGIVVIAPVESATDAMADIPSDVPLVAVDGDLSGRVAVVTVDQHLGARMATQHLLDAGHATVWHVAGPAGWFDSAGREEGWRAALTDAGAEVPHVLRADWTAASGYAAGLDLAARTDVTAVFTANDHLALGVLRALNESGRRVPEDISVVGFDDVPEAAFFIPPLTSVRPDFALVAQRTMSILLEQLDADTTRPRATRAKVLVAPTLRVRASVRPPRARTGTTYGQNRE